MKGKCSKYFSHQKCCSTKLGDNTPKKNIHKGFFCLFSRSTFHTHLALNIPPPPRPGNCQGTSFPGHWPTCQGYFSIQDFGDCVPPRTRGQKHREDQQIMQQRSSQEIKETTGDGSAGASWLHMGLDILIANQDPHDRIKGKTWPIIDVSKKIFWRST